MAGFFFTGEESAALTPKAIERRRALLDALGKDAYSTAPVAHWTQGAARLVNALANNVEESRLNKAEKRGLDEGHRINQEFLDRYFGMGPAGASSPMPAAAPEAAGGSASPPVASPDVSRETVPLPQQPLMPNRPQMPVSSIATAEDGTPLPPVRPSTLGIQPGAIPQQFGTLPSRIGEALANVPQQPTPLWMQGGMTKGLPAVGQMPVSPSMAFAAPGQMVPMGGAAPQMAAGGDSQWQRMKMQESGNRQFDRSGNVVTSPKGATGIAQVMPSTGPEAARLAGLPWDPVRFRNDAKYNEALGKAYFDAQQRTFNDPVAAAAAYNAGPGRVNQAIAQQERTGQPYTDFLPRETQDYIAKVAGPDLPAASAQEAQNLQRPAPGQFNIPGQQGATPDRTMAIIRALSNPWAQQANPMLAGVAQKVLADQLAGNKLSYQTDADGNIIALDPTGRQKPSIVYRAAPKPIILQEGGKAIVADPAAPGGYREVAAGGDKGTGDQKNYEAAVKGGFKGSFADYQVMLKRAGSAQPESTFNVEMAKGQAKNFNEMAGELPAAKSDIANVKALRQQLDKLPGGFMGNAQAMAVRMGIKVGENASAVEAADAILARLTPAQRQGMPGAASDRDVAMFRAALPQLGQTKEGQKIILDTMEGLAQYKLKQAELAMQVSMGRMKPEQAMEALGNIPDPFDQFRAIQGKATPQTGPVRVNSPAEAAKLPKGTRFIDPNGVERIVP